MTTPLTLSPGDRVTARALLIGDRLDTAGLERGDALSVTPLSFRAGTNGVVTLFRYGVVVLVGLSPIEEDERLLVISEALAKSVVLAQDEREVSSVFDQIEPFARKLAYTGRIPGGRRTILRLIG